MWNLKLRKKYQEKISIINIQAFTGEKNTKTKKRFTNVIK